MRFSAGTGCVGRQVVDGVVDAPCLTAADGSGYEIDPAEVIYWGRCPECASEPSEGNSPRGERSP